MPVIRQRNKFSYEHCSVDMMVRFGTPFLPTSELVFQMGSPGLECADEKWDSFVFTTMGVCFRGNPPFRWLLARCFSAWAILKILFLWFLPFIRCNLNSFVEHCSVSVEWYVIYIFIPFLEYIPMYIVYIHNINYM